MGLPRPTPESDDCRQDSSARVKEKTIMGGLSWWHWLVVGAVFILLFGAKRLPDAARGVGRSLRILKSEVSAMNLDDGQPADAAAAGDVRVAPIEATPTVHAPAQ
jgi:sec-independent protein translocase protein TatA